MTSAVIAVILTISSFFAGLTVKINNDVMMISTNIGLGILLSPWAVPRDRNYVWVYYAVLKVIVALLTCSFQVVLTVRICSTLKKSIKFLTTANVNNGHGVLVYRKILKYSISICIISVSYLVFKCLSVALEVHRHLYANVFSISHLSFFSYAQWKNIVINLGPYIINLTVCIKPLCIGSTYLWLKIS